MTEPPATRLRDVLGSRFAADTAGLTAAQWAAALVGLLTTFLAASVFLGPSAFGTAAVVMAYASIVGGFVGAKTTPVTLRYVSGFLATNRRDEVLAVCKVGFAVDFALAATATALTLILVLIVASPPGAAHYGWLIALSAGARPFKSVRNTGVAILSALYRFKAVSVLTVAERVLVLGAVVIACAIEPGVEQFVVASAAGDMLAGLAWLVFSSTTLRTTVGSWWPARWSHLREFRADLRSMLGWNFLGITFTNAMVHGPIILLGAMHGPVQAGYFRIASATATAADYAEIALIRVASPPLAEAHAKGDRAGFRKLITAWARREGPLAALVVVAGMAVVPGVIPLIFGSEFSGLVVGLEFMLFGVAVSTATFFVAPALYAQGRVKTWVLANGCYSVVSLGVGAAIASSAGFSGFALLSGVGLAVMNACLALVVVRDAVGDRPQPEGPRASDARLAAPVEKT